MAGAKEMRPRPRRLPGDPLAVAVARGDAPVEGARRFPRHERASGGETQQEAAVERRRRSGAHALDDGNPGGAQPRGALAGHPRVGVAQREHAAGDSGVYQSVGAGRRAPPVGAGFERDIRAGAPCGGAGAAQRLGLGVGAPARLRPAAPHDSAVARQHAADGGVRPDAAEAARGKRQRRVHPAAVFGRGFSRHRGATGCR